MEINNGLGLKIASSNPAPYMSNVSVYSKVELTFDNDLDTKTVGANVRLYESLAGKFTSIRDLDDVSKNIPVECGISYKDRVVTLSPRSPLTAGRLYIVYVPDMAIKSITGQMMLSSYTNQFSTESKAKPAQPQDLNPGIGEVLDRNLQLFKWSPTGEAYTVQVSKSPTFETLILDEVTDVPQFQPEPLSLAEGRYYWRVRALEGEWSELSIFFVKAFEDAPISHEDSMPIDPVMPWEEPFEVLEVFPEDGFSSVGTNLKSVYVKVKGMVAVNDIQFDLSGVVGEFSDEDDSLLTSAHGDVAGNWTIIQDSRENASYIIFTMEKL